MSDFAEMAKKREIEAQSLSDEDVFRSIIKNFLHIPDAPVEMKVEMIFSSVADWALIKQVIEEEYRDGLLTDDEFKEYIEMYSRMRK